MFLPTNRLVELLRRHRLKKVTFNKNVKNNVSKKYPKNISYRFPLNLKPKKVTFNNNIQNSVGKKYPKNDAYPLPLLQPSLVTREFHKNLFNRINVRGDGSCFYRAVYVSSGMGVRSNENSGVRLLRTRVERVARDYLDGVNDNNFVTSPINTGGPNAPPMTKMEFFRNLPSMGCWASQLEVMLTARILNRRIICLYDSGKDDYYRMYPQFTILSYSNRFTTSGGVPPTPLPRQNPIYIFYNARGVNKRGNHFEALVPR